ncbi:hypothetical protein GmHk_13G036426 [Glycine max]|nr:hypothetical protein GmHk_13G036426 [Glycine max]
MKLQDWEQLGRKVRSKDTDSCNRSAIVVACNVFDEIVLFLRCFSLSTSSNFHFTVSFALNFEWQVKEEVASHYLGQGGIGLVSSYVAYSPKIAS